MAENY